MKVSIHARSMKQAEEMMDNVRKINPDAVITNWDIQVEGVGPIILKSLSVVGWTLFGLACVGVFNRD